MPRNAQQRGAMYHANAENRNGGVSSDTLLYFLMQVFRPAAHVVGAVDGTQFGKKYRILPTLRSSYIVRQSKRPGFGALKSFVKCTDDENGNLKGSRFVSRKHIHKTNWVGAKCWSIVENCPYEHFLRRTFASQPAWNRQYKNSGADVEQSLRLRHKSIASTMGKFRLFVGRHVWAAPGKGLLKSKLKDDKQLMQYAAGQFLIERGSDSEGFHVATDRGGLKMRFCVENQCIALNANGMPCRNAGKKYRPALDGSHARESLFCEFHCSLVPKSCRHIKIPEDLATRHVSKAKHPLPPARQSDDVDGDRYGDSDEGSSGDKDESDEGEGSDCRVSLSMAPLGGRSKKTREPQRSAHQNRGLLVTYKNLDADIGVFVSNDAGEAVRYPCLKQSMKTRRLYIGSAIRGRRLRAANPARRWGRLPILVRANLSKLTPSEYNEKMKTKESVENYCMRFSTLVTATGANKVAVGKHELQGGGKVASDAGSASAALRHATRLRAVSGLSVVRQSSPRSRAHGARAAGRQGHLDLGQGELGQGELGQGELGQGELGQSWPSRCR